MKDKQTLDAWFVARENSCKYCISPFSCLFVDFKVKCMNELTSATFFLRLKQPLQKQLCHMTLKLIDLEYLASSNRHYYQ